MSWSKRRHPRLVDDIALYAAHIDDENLQIAQEFLIAVGEQLIAIAEQPLATQPAKFAHPALQDFRWRWVSRRFRNYLIYLHVDEAQQEVAIYALIHGKRLLERHLLRRSREAWDTSNPVKR